MHCGGEHELASCPDLTTEQLGQILLQIIAAEGSQDDDDGVEKYIDGGALQQARGNGSNAGLKSNYLYLDTCTTDDVACNEAYLSKIHKAKKPLRLHTNAGASRLEQQGYLGHFRFWLDRFGIASVISLSTLESAFRVSYDSKRDGGAFIVDTPRGKIVFKRCKDTGFPYIDLDDDDSDAAIMLVQTIRKNFEGYTRREVERAIEARKLQNMTGHASEGAFKSEVSRKPLESTLFKDSSVKPADIAVARTIFGPSDHCLKGKWVRGKPKRVDEGIVSIPVSIMERCRGLTLTADVMFVCGLPFLITLSRKVRFVTVQYVPCRTAPELANAVKNVLKVYHRSGFKPRLALMDGEFDKLRDRLADSIEINVAGMNEHVAEIERMIRQVKERCRCVNADIPFNVLPNAVIKALVIHVVMWLNAWPAKAGVSEDFSPREIVLRWQLSTKLHCRGQFGSYCIAYDENTPTNTQQLRGRDCICLGPTGNRQGTYKFLDLETWRVIKRKQFKEYPMPKSILNKVEAMGRKNKQDGRLKFADRRNIEFDWSLAEEEEPLIEDNAVEPEAPYPDIPAEMPGVLTEEQVPAVETPDAGPQNEGEAPDERERADAAARNANFGPGVAAIVGDGVAGRAQALENDRDEVVFNVNIVPAENDEFENEQQEEDEEPTGIEYEQEDDDDETYNPAFDGDVEEDDDDLPPGFSDEGYDSSDSEDEHEDIDEERRRRNMHVARSRRAREVRGVDRLNLAQARKKAGVHEFGKIEGGETASCSETESETESESEDEVVETKGKGKRTPIPLGTRSPRVATARAVNELINRVYNESGEETPIIVSDDDVEAMGAIMIQLSLKQGLREWGERAEKSAIKEMRQMHDMSAFFPRDPKSLSRLEKQRALRSIIFVKEKRDKSIKTRACINGAPQRAYIPKEDAASPTAWNDSLFITGAIDAKEGRDVAYADMPGAFLHTLTDEKIVVLLTGELCELMVKVEPSLYRKYVTVDRKGTPMLYVELYKSVYGLLRSALLFYRKLKGELMSYGFEMNPYDPCVANMDTPGGQMTVLWHVDDLKISCKDSFEITKLLSYLNKLYGRKLGAHCGKKGEHLGMNLDFSEPGVFTVDMIPYIKTIINDFPEEIKHHSPTPHADHLFKVRDEADAKYLPEEQARAFHHAVAQLLFLACCARRDIQTAVSFLTTRVRAPDEDDWGKVRRVLQYLKGTLYLKLRLTAESLVSALWFIDGSDGVHWDCKGQTGAGMTLGKGALISFSRKHKTNTRSSTESEIVSVDDAITTVLWSLYFIQAQGYDMVHATIYQDNKSAILLEKNGKMSSSKRTKHIKKKYFFVTDKVEQGEVQVEHMPTDKMWIDVNTKPKMGRGYRVDRSMIMNCPIDLPTSIAYEPM